MDVPYIVLMNNAWPQKVVVVLSKWEDRRRSSMHHLEQVGEPYTRVLAASQLRMKNMKPEQNGHSAKRRVHMQQDTYATAINHKKIKKKLAESSVYMVLTYTRRVYTGRYRTYYLNNIFSPRFSLFVSVMAHLRRIRVYIYTG